MLVHLESKGIDTKTLNDNIGNTIQFSNGCWLCLEADNGMYWGETIYGVEWGCNSAPGYEQKIINWLEHWNTPRDEKQRKIQDAYK